MGKGIEKMKLLMIGLLFVLTACDKEPKLSPAQATFCLDYSEMLWQKKQLDNNVDYNTCVKNHPMWFDPKFIAVKKKYDEPGFECQPYSYKDETYNRLLEYQQKAQFQKVCLEAIGAEK